MNTNNTIRNQLEHIINELQQLSLWQSTPPGPDAFLSEAPFAIDTMDPHEWLQWIFIPKMQALIDQNGALPTGFALHPYFEEAFKQQHQFEQLLSLIKQLDELSAKCE